MTALDVSGTSGRGAGIALVIGGAGWDGSGRGQLHLSGLDLNGLDLDRFHRFGRTGNDGKRLRLDHPIGQRSGLGLGRRHGRGGGGEDRSGDRSGRVGRGSRGRLSRGGGDLNRILRWSRGLRSLLGLGLRDIGGGFGRVALGDRGDGALAGGLFEIFGEQVAHDGVARAAAAASQDHADQEAVAAVHRGHEIESRGARVTGLDAVHAFDAADQVIVIADRLAMIVERCRGEVAIVARKAVLDGAAQRRLIARRRDLFVVGQARGIAIGRPAHAERARLAGHHLGEIVFIAADGFRDHDGGVIGGARHQSLDGVLDADGLTRAQPELGGSLLGGVFGNLPFRCRASSCRRRGARTADRAS